MTQRLCSFSLIASLHLGSYTVESYFAVKADIKRT